MYRIKIEAEKMASKLKESVVKNVMNNKIEKSIEYKFGSRLSSVYN